MTEPSDMGLAVGGGTEASGRPPIVGDSKGQPANVFARDPVGTGTLDELRHNELIPIHRALGRMCLIDKPKWRQRLDASKLWGAGAVLFLGGAIGGTLAFLPFLLSNPGPSGPAKWGSVAGLAVAAFVGILCAIARMNVDEVKIDSAHSVYEMVNDILKSYEAALKNAASTANPESPKP